MKRFIRFTDTARRQETTIFRTTKRPIALGIALTGALPLSACSAGSLGSSTSNGDSSGGAATVTISLLTDTGDQTVKPMKAAVDAFEAANLRSVIVTVVVVQSVFVFTDVQNPLYFLPGDGNATVQLTLLHFQSQFNTSYNLLFTNILLITMPMLVMCIFFQRQIVAGMTAGAVKG